jgi:hypothetical protein
VTQTNGWAESDPIEASLAVPAEGYFVRSASRIDELQYVTGHGPGDSQTDLEIMEPPDRRGADGRREKLILNWGSTGYEGQFELLVSDRDSLDLLRGYKEAGEPVMFKFPYGAVRYAIITQTPDTDGVGDWFGEKVSYIEIAPESAGF